MVDEDGVNWYQPDTTISGPLNVEGSQCKELCRKIPDCKIAPFQKMWTTFYNFFLCFKFSIFCSDQKT